MARELLVQLQMARAYRSKTNKVGLWCPEFLKAQLQWLPQFLLLVRRQPVAGPVCIAGRHSHRHSHSPLGRHNLVNPMAALIFRAHFSPFSHIRNLLQ